MIHKFKSFIAACSPKKAPRLDPFDSLAQDIRNVRPNARSSFKDDLKGQLLALHQDMMQSELKRGTKFFYVHKFAAMATAVMLLVVIGGGGLVVSADAPMPTTHTMANLEETIQPDIAPITIDFDQPMMRGSVEAAFTITPQVEGNFIWDGYHRVHFLPNENLSAGTDYVVTVSSEARSMFQKPLQGPYERSFETFEMPLPQEGLPDLAALQELRAEFPNLSPEEKQRVQQRLIEMETQIQDYIEEYGPLPPPPHGNGPVITPPSPAFQSA